MHFPPLKTSNLNNIKVDTDSTCKVLVLAMVEKMSSFDTLIDFYAIYLQSDVYICMELMTTCLDKLMKKLQGPIPEEVLGKISVSVSI